MLYFNWLIISFHHFYNFNLIKICSYYKHNIYIPKTNDYLEIFSDEEVKDFVGINFSESLREEKILRKVDELLYIFLTTSDEVQLSSSDNWVHHYNVKILNIFDPEL